jgi:Ca2+-binding RTX toxin-like protein
MDYTGDTDDDSYVLILRQGVYTITDLGGSDSLELRSYAYGGWDLYRQGTDLIISNSAGGITTISDFTTTSGAAGVSAIETLFFTEFSSSGSGTFELKLALGDTGSSGNDWVAGTTGSDTLTGGAGYDVLQGDAGADSISGDADDDVLIGGSGNDTLKGGAGNDTYILWQSGSSTTISSGADVINDTGGSDSKSDILELRSYAEGDWSFYRQGNDMTLKDTAGNITTIKNFSTSSGSAGAGAIETLLYIFGDTGDSVEFSFASGSTGGADNDWIAGTSGNDTLTGGDGTDVFTGHIGNDSISGGDGWDWLVGGLGKDTLRGGSDLTRDTFEFDSASKTLVGTNRDTIYNFVSKTDKIELLSIDANSTVTGNQAFRFNTTTAKANSIWYKTADVDKNSATKDIIIYGDTNGNTTADFEIGLVGVTSVTSTDFFL